MIINSNEKFWILEYLNGNFALYGISENCLFNILSFEWYAKLDFIQSLFSYSKHTNKRFHGNNGIVDAIIILRKDFQQLEYIVIIKIKLDKKRRL